MTNSNITNAKLGKIIQVIGPVVDVEFGAQDE
jgi:F0F1-type ATP synthase beta subunit